MIMGPLWSLSYSCRPVLGGRIQAFLLRLLGVNVRGSVWFEGVPLISSPKNLTIGKRVAVGHNAKFICFGPVEIGDDCMLAANFTINSASHDVSSLRPYCVSTVVGSRVWIGLNVCICAGVNVGDDSVIGAGSIVLKDVASNTVSAGVPCRFIRNIDRGGVRVFSVFKDVWGLE